MISFVLGIIILSVSFAVFLLLGYLNIPGLVLVWVMIAGSAILMIKSVMLPFGGLGRKISTFEKNGKIVSLMPVVVMVAIFVVFYLLTGVLNMQGTDEINIDYYAGYLVSHGINPYVAANMGNVFNFMHFPADLSTPLLNGGYVTYFSYPALIALVFAPAAFFKVNDVVVPLLFTLSTFLVLYFSYYRPRTPNFVYLLVLISLLAYYSYLAVGGVVDSVWVFFIVIAFLSRKKPVYSGIFFGLSLAAKQIPIVIFPFFLYMIFRENSRRAKSAIYFTISMTFLFLIINLPFIIVSPGNWLSAMLSILSSQLVGVGFGPSALAFTGFLQISHAFFTFSLISVAIFLFLIYLLYYQRLKFAFFIFPVIIFLFNYRVETDYLNFWPILLLPVLWELHTFRKPETIWTPDPIGKVKASSLKVSAKKKKIVVIGISVFLVASIAAAGFYYSGVAVKANRIEIDGVSGIVHSSNDPGKIVSITLKMYFEPGSNVPPPGRPFFTIYVPFHANSLVTGNMNPLLWTATSDISTGYSIITIAPEYNSSVLNINTPFRLVAYYAGYTGVLLSSGIH
ncbi:MAG: hypothetical protein QW597_07185 [Thermoplasmataceae archaeon]